MEQQLRYHVHAGRVAKRGLQLRVTRQLYTSMTARVVDYASLVWSTFVSARTVTTADQVQQLGVTAIKAGSRRYH